jgi:hypothetical protein
VAAERHHFSAALIAPNPQHHVVIENMGWWESCGLVRPSERGLFRPAKLAPRPEIASCELCRKAVA